MQYFVIERDHSGGFTRWTGDGWGMPHTSTHPAHDVTVYRSKEEAESDALFVAAKFPELLSKIRVVEVEANRLCSCKK